MKYDFHCHSTFSDGTLTPTQLLQRASDQGVNILALTDHDNIDGLIEARVAAHDHNINLINGVEISTTWRKQLLHIVGLGVDTNNHALAEGLASVKAARSDRAIRIAEDLERHGIHNAYQGAQQYCQQSIMSRTHFARFLVDQGHAKDMGQVFKRFLTRGKPGYVSCEWADLSDAVSWITQAGGVAVIAHPARYKLTLTKMKELLSDFSEYGGQGLEVIGSGHNTKDTELMSVLAEEFGLLSSAGSDFHDPNKGFRELGKIPPFPSRCQPIWHHDSILIN